jgi:hypothetical protein
MCVFRAASTFLRVILGRPGDFRSGVIGKGSGDQTLARRLFAWSDLRCLAPFRPHVQEPEVGPVGKRARLIGQGSPFSDGRGSATSGWKDLPSAN